MSRVMPRARYQRVSIEDRQRIVDAFRDGVDYVAGAAQLGVRRGAAYSIVLSGDCSTEYNLQPWQKKKLRVSFFYVKLALIGGTVE